MFRKTEPKTKNNKKGEYHVERDSSVCEGRRRCIGCGVCAVVGARCSWHGCSYDVAGHQHRNSNQQCGERDCSAGQLSKSGHKTMKVRLARQNAGQPVSSNPLERWRGSEL